MTEKLDIAEQREEKHRDQLCRIASLTSDIEKLKAERESLLNINSELSYNLGHRERNIISLHSCLKAAQDKVEYLQNDKNNITHEIYKMMKHHEEIILGKSLEHKIQEVSERITNLGNRINMLKKNNSLILHSKINYGNQKLKNSLEKHLHSFKQMKQTLADADKHYKEKIHNLEFNIEHLNNELMSKKRSQNKLKSLLNRSSKKIKSTDEEMKAKDKEMDKKIEEINNLAKTLKEHQDVIIQLKNLDEEYHKCKDEVQQEKMIRQSLEKVNEKIKDNVALLKRSLEDAEEKSKQDANNYYVKLRHLSKQVSHFKREAACKDATIFNIISFFNKECSISNNRLWELWNKNILLDGETITWKRREMEIEKQNKELKNLLKESHNREEEALLRERHFLMNGT